MEVRGGQLRFRRTPTPDDQEWFASDRIAEALTELWRNCSVIDATNGITPEATMLTVGPDRLEWFEGLRAGLYRSLDEHDRKTLLTILDLLREGQSVDLWFTKKGDKAP